MKTSLRTSPPEPAARRVVRRDVGQRKTKDGGEKQKTTQLGVVPSGAVVCALARYIPYDTIPPPFHFHAQGFPTDAGSEDSRYPL